MSAQGLISSHVLNLAFRSSLTIRSARWLLPGHHELTLLSFGLCLPSLELKGPCTSTPGDSMLPVAGDCSSLHLGPPSLCVVPRSPPQPSGLHKLFPSYPCLFHSRSFLNPYYSLRSLRVSVCPLQRSILPGTRKHCLYEPPKSSGKFLTSVQVG